MVSRSERGIVAVILKDNTSSFDTKTYTKESEIVKSHYTTTNLAFLSHVFQWNPSAVFVARIGTDGSIDTALERLKNKKWNWLTVPSVQSGETGTIADWIRDQRSTYHKTLRRTARYRCRQRGCCKLCYGRYQGGYKNTPQPNTVRELQVSLQAFL